MSTVLIQNLTKCVLLIKLIMLLGKESAYM